MLETKNLQLAYDKDIIVDKLDLVIQEGKINILIGANGCGKSTILSALGRVLKSRKGDIFLKGKNINEYKNKDIAKLIAFLPQNPQGPSGITVEQLCYFGRHPHQNLLGKKTNEDKRAVEEALHLTDTWEFRNKKIESLSGGQRQRVWIAMALSQDTPVLLLDEPTTYLDIAHQIEVMNILKELNEKKNKTIVAVLHELNQAASYAHNIICIKKGSIVKAGRVEDVFTEDIIKEVFNFECKVVKDNLNNKLMCIPLLNID